MFQIPPARTGPATHVGDKRARHKERARLCALSRPREGCGRRVQVLVRVLSLVQRRDDGDGRILGQECCRLR